MITMSEAPGEPMNYVDYFTKQLPLDLARLAQLRDELALRQGAMNAVQDATKDRDAAAADRSAAAAELASTRQEIAALAAQAQEFLASAKATEKSQNDRIGVLDERERRLEAQESALTERSRQHELMMDTARCELDARISAFNADRAELDLKIQRAHQRLAMLTDPV